MLIRDPLRGRLDELVTRGQALRRQAGVFGTIGFRDVLMQAVETGVEAMEAGFAEAETRDRRVLLPKEWAARLGRPAGSGAR